jgi:hypothetical protein
LAESWLNYTAECCEPGERNPSILLFDATGELLTPV